MNRNQYDVVTNKSIDKKLHKMNPNVKRIGNYVNANTNIEWKCHICNGRWFATPNNVTKTKKPTGCPYCRRSWKLTNDDVDKRLENRTVERIGDYINNKSKMKMRCKKCGHIWSAKADNVLNNNRNCPMCFRVYNNDLLFNHLINKPFTLLKGNVKSANSRVKLQCNKNKNHIWTSTVGNLIGNNRGCPFCVYKGEQNLFDLICQIFSRNNVKRNYYLKINNKRYYIDFRIKLNNITVFVERQGEQHYYPVDFGQGKMKSKIDFIKQKERDNIIKNYCYINNIYFIEIPYFFNDEETIISLSGPFSLNI